MREPTPCRRPVPHRVWLAVSILFLNTMFIVAGPWSAGPAYAVDDITLDLHHGASPGQVVLDWAGGSAPYEVYRASSPAAVIAPGNKLGESQDPAWTDVPPAGGLHFFYLIQSTDN